jgi:hypothetical protein
VGEAAWVDRKKSVSTTADEIGSVNTALIKNTEQPQLQKVWVSRAVPL